MSIAFPLSIAVQLTRAESLTKLWAKEKKVNWPDCLEWKVKVPHRHSDLHIFSCYKCGSPILRKIIGSYFFNIPRVCNDCRQRSYESKHPRIAALRNAPMDKPNKAHK